MEELKISVIVPVYNTGDYLERCVESLVGQTYRNTEIVLVNDGSTDDSLTVMERLAEKYGNVLCMDKAHEGVSAARNAALNAISGDVVAFVDSDDWLSPDAYDIMIRTMQEEAADLVYGDWLYEYSDGTNALHIKNSTRSVIAGKADVLRACLDGSGINHTRSLFKRKLIGDTRFETKYTFGEDILFSFLTVSKADKIIHLPLPFYHRYFRVGSITNVRGFKPRYAETAYCTDDIVAYVKREYPEFTELAYQRSFVMYEMLLNRMVYYGVQKEYPEIWEKTCSRLSGIYQKAGHLKPAPKMAYQVFTHFPKLYRIIVIFYYRYYKKELDGKRQK